MMSVHLTIRKHPSETLNEGVNFRNELFAGETIVSATANVIGAGTITVGATPSVASPIVTCVIAAGTDGHTDLFLILATTSAGQVIPATIYVEVGTIVQIAAAGMYTTPDGLLGNLSADFIAQLSMDGGATADPALVDQVIKNASHWIDGYLGRFVPPMVIGTNATQGTLDVLEIHCIIVSKWMLLGRKTAGDSLKQPDEGFQATKRFLEGVQGGKPFSGATEPAVATTSNSVTGSVMAGEIVFDDESAVL